MQQSQDPKSVLISYLRSYHNTEMGCLSIRMKHKAEDAERASGKKCEAYQVAIETIESRMLK